MTKQAGSSPFVRPKGLVGQSGCVSPVRVRYCSWFYLTASRSPPGLGALSVSSSAHFGVIFGVVFGSWGQYGGAVGSFFGADGDLARQRRLKRRLPQNKVTILDPSWEPKPTKNDQKSMPRCVQILHWFSDRFLIDFGDHLGTILGPCWASCGGSATLRKSLKNLHRVHVFNEFSWFGKSKLE